uniref:Cytochrome c biogenesis protein CcsA n=2 Tax=Ulva TaxID=3118 RepID=A0A7L9K1W9_9CHLO|nr:cytochrome c biogenesis protein CcsA [Ulva lacinulata]QOK35468.1 cytochrome c biogenesis protein CcsA [Ulva lacinulata]QWL15313.1 cytochrome c biogenesis protein CcsA [Ulva lacinulata]ULC80459.1 cytochrome c biogenesis protein CcsA [Ulva lacinulata]
MFNINLETSLININFIILFVAMILYWLKSSFFLKSFSNLPDILIIISNILQFSFLCIRWVNSNHFPLSNLYESLLFLSYSLTSILIIFNFNINVGKKNYFKNFYNNLVSLFLKNNNKINKTVYSNNSFLNSIFGSILTPLILLLNTFANFSLPIELKTANALVPALKSNWLLMHVTVMILSYAALLCGCLFSIAYLILTFVSNFLYNKNKKLLLFDNQLDSENYLYENSNSIKKDNLVFNSYFFDINNIKETEFENTTFRKDFILDNLVSLMLTLDNLSYRILGLGFPLLTMGLLSGAVWANQTWGSYWSWDPKETWALITWFIFAIYFHTRLSKGWNGFKSSLLASFGFIIIWICYLGVNLMGKGLHSYGFLS